ncbi:Uncharacterised protein [Mycobacteroides abscessus subsp. massiliense]|nr:Uncharacterised protein [Mycobacteroides abscessus subsp. massiliense]SKT94325.1 Uncharacterised protein [Mycobacteroides abscessus subsp. abscessus]
MSSRLSFRAVETDASLSEVVPSASRLSATKLLTLPTTSLRSLTAPATSPGSSASSPVTEARFPLRVSSSPALSFSAVTSVAMFLTLVKMSPL